MQAVSRRVVIVGGGIAGLTCAYTLADSVPRLTRAGLPITCTLIECAPRLGGKILTDEADGFVVEGGPDSFLAQKPWGLELCRRLGLADRVIGTNPDRRRTFVLSEGRLHELPEGLVMGLPAKLGPIIRSDILSWPGKLRLAADLIVPRRPQAGDESLGSFFRRRLGAEALERLIEPLLTGIYAGDADQLSILATFPRFREMERERGSLIRSFLAMWWEQRSGEKNQESRWTPFVTLRGGLTEMVQALTARLKEVTVLTGRRVQEVRVRGGGSSYEVLVDGGQAVPADAVVLATPAYDAASLVEPLNRTLAEMLRGIPYTGTATVSLGFRKEGFSHDLDGYGFVVPRIEGRFLLASTWTSSKWKHRTPDGAVLIRSYLGGVGRETALERTDEELVKLVREELQVAMGVEEEPILARVYRWPRAMPQYLVGHLDRLRVMDEMLERLPGIFLTGAGYRGVGLPYCIKDGTLTAERVLRYLSKGAPRSEE
jgi:oxygen-dependent protoporphyrinogen oxidase